MRAFQKFKEELPNKERFYSSSIDQTLADKEYEHAFNVWKNIWNENNERLSRLVFKMKRFIISWYVWKKKIFRNNSLNNLSRGAMLKITKTELELILDPDTYIFFEKGLRGGISYISNRYRKAISKNLKSYEPKQESKQIIYLDASDLCGHAMSKFLLTSWFKWMEPKEFGLNKYTSNTLKRCVLEVDLEYPK